MELTKESVNLKIDQKKVYKLKKKRLKILGEKIEPCRSMGQYKKF